MILFTKTKEGVEEYVEVTRVRHYPDRMILMYTLVTAKDKQIPYSEKVGKEEERLDLRLMSVVTVNNKHLIPKKDNQ